LAGGKPSKSGIHPFRKTQGAHHFAGFGEKNHSGSSGDHRPSGRTSILEALSVIKNYCRILIVPEGGILSLLYYLGVTFPIMVISLWGDARQGILKQSMPSPNRSLRHIPLVWKGDDVASIAVEEVVSSVRKHGDRWGATEKAGCAAEGKPAGNLSQMGDNELKDGGT
jgi:hypothetical protein